MSDETGAAVAPPVESAPAVEAPQVETAVEQPIELEAGGKNARRRNVAKLAERAATKMADQRAAADAAKERHHQPRVEAGKPEGGQFKAADAEGSVSEAEVAPTGSTELQATASQDAGADPAVDQSKAGDGSPPEGYVDVPLPDGHPLRDRGLTHLRAVATQEREIRAGINAHMDKVTLQRELEVERRERALLEARQRALSGEVTPYETKPEYQALFEQIREAPGFGEEVAAEVIAGLQALNDKRIGETESKAMAEYEAQRHTESFAQNTFQRAGEVLKVWADSGELQNRLPRLLEEYCLAVDKRNETTGRHTKPDTAEFLKWVRPVYAGDPRVKQTLEQLREADAERERAKIRLEVQAELEREQKAKAEEAAARHSARPPLTRRGSVSSTPVTEPTEEPLAPTGPGSYRKQAKALIREKYRGMTLGR